MAAPRVVLVWRRTEYDELLARHQTAGQADFFLRSRAMSLDPVRDRHVRATDAVRAVLGAIPSSWRRAEVERHDLPRFLFEPDDIVAVVGPDGLVANASKYLTDQRVLGFDPFPGMNPGVLVPHSPSDAAGLFATVAAASSRELVRTMVLAVSDDGQELTGLNEIYVGQPGHQSSRYELSWRGRAERQSSSGLIVGTGTGATGWCASIRRTSAPTMELPDPADHDLVWFVREPWPSPTTATDLSAGPLADGESLTLHVGSDSLVVFADGLEDDRLVLGWGQRLEVRRAPSGLRTVI
ncbi:MAG: hypothetical protein ACRCYX_02385 [Dermatophilaceae bacterium]